MDAAIKNNIHMVSLLLNAGVDVNAQDDEGWTALHHAVEKNMIELTALLLQQPAIDVTMKRRWGDTPLHIAAREDLSGKLVAMLLQAGAHYNSKTKSGGSTPLSNAIHHKNIEATRLLIAVGANVNINHYSFLDYCTKYQGYHDNRLEVAQLLLRAGIIVDRVEKTDGRYIDMTPLKYAIVGNDHEMVALLAHYGADVNAVIKYKGREHLNQNILFYAINQGYLEMVKTLLKFGVVVDTIKSKKQRFIDMTELQLAVGVKDLESASLLIAYGANPHALLKIEQGDKIREISTLGLAILVKSVAAVDLLYRAGVALDGIKISDQYIIDVSGLGFPRAGDDKEMISILTSGGAQISTSNGPLKLNFTSIFYKIFSKRG
ncbi:ankyrin repeat domain-containing protein [Candidatus Chromulinivorax destructor]|nr:ankyrin repeat domain-containing protein [Candidatus Chromulinivorax destructor]